MIAPLDPVLTTSHPKFEALYRDLCTNKVNSDATSKLDPKAQKERDSLSEVRAILFDNSHKVVASIISCSPISTLGS